MANTSEMAKVSAKGGFHLLWGLVLSTIISAVGAIVIALLLGADNYGIYTIAIAAPNLIAAFRDWGITSAIVKFTAQYNYEKDFEKTKSIFFSGLIFEFVFGSVLSLVSYFLSGFLASTFSRPEITLLIQIASFSILTHALMNLATAVFVGMERMHLNSFMLVIQSLVKTGLIIGFVVAGLGNVGAVSGFLIGTLVAGVVGLMLAWVMYGKLRFSAVHKMNISHTVKYLLKYGLPLSVGSILTVFLTQFYIYAMAIFVTDNAAIGNYSVASNFAVLITFFATPVTTMLFPAFSKINYEKDAVALQTVFRYSVKYSSIIIVPFAAILMVLAEPAINAIFAGGYSQAPLFLSLSLILYLYTVFGSLSIPNLINGQGHTAVNLKLTVLTVATGLPVGLLLISQFGLIGLIVTSLIATLPSLIISVVFIRRKYGLSLDWFSSIKILFSSGVAALVTFVIISYFSFPSIIELIFGLLVFLVFIVLLFLVTRTVDKVDLVNIREIAGGLGPLSRIVRWLVDLLDRLISVMRL